MSEPILLLLLEDEAAARETLSRLIEEEFAGDVKVFPVESPEEATQILREQPIAIAIVDIMMANRQPDGEAVARDASLNGVATIVYSRHPTPAYEDRVRGRSSGPVDFVRKSSSPKTLLDCVRLRVHFVRAARDAAVRRNQDELTHHCFGWVRGAGVAVRFLVGTMSDCELRQLRTGFSDRESAQLFSLTSALNAWDRIVRREHGRLLLIHGHSTFSLFPDDEGTGLSRAVSALKRLRKVAQAEGDRVWDKIRFAAGLMPGRFVNGLFGERMPGHPAVVSPLVEVTQAIADNAKPMTAGTVESWLTPQERKMFETLGGEPAETHGFYPGFDQDGGFAGLPVVARQIDEPGSRHVQDP